MKKYCPKCNKYLSNEMSFCPTCGTRLIEKETEEEIYRREYVKLDPYIKQINTLEHRLYDTYYDFSPFFKLSWRIDSTNPYKYQEKISGYVFRTARSRKLPWVDKTTEKDLLRTYLISPISKKFTNDVMDIIQELIDEFKRLLELVYNKERRVFIDHLDEIYQEVDSNYSRYLYLRKNPPRGKIDFFMDNETLDALDQFLTIYFYGGKKTITYPDLGIFKHYTYELNIAKSEKAYISSLLPNSICNENDSKVFFRAVKELEEMNKLLKYSIRYFNNSFEEGTWRYPWVNAVPSRCEKKFIK